jgi:hypothetical protein
MSRLTGRGYSSADASMMMDRCNGPHSFKWKVSVWRGTTQLYDDIPLTGGTLTLDSSDPIRRHLTLEVGGGEKWAPKNANSPLVPFGQRITLWVTCDRQDGSWLPWLKMGEYSVFTHSFERPSMMTTVECHDISGAVDEYLLLGKRSFVDQTIRDAIVDLCEEAVPGYVFGVVASAASDDPDKAIKNYVADAGTSRWEACVEMASRRGHEAFFNANGDLVLRYDVTDDNDESIPGVGPDIGTVSSPIATIKDGQGGNLVGLTATVSREGATNGVRINMHSTVPRKVRKKINREPLAPLPSGATPSQIAARAAEVARRAKEGPWRTDWEDAPIHAHVSEFQESGPVAWGGLFGRIPIVIERDLKDLKRWSNGGAETWSNAQADAHHDARKMLHRRRGVTRYLDIHTLPMYWLEADDKVRVQWHDGATTVTEYHFVQRVEFDLAGGPMVVRTRQLNVVDPGG